MVSIKSERFKTRRKQFESLLNELYGLALCSSSQVGRGTVIAGLAMDSKK